MDEKRKIMQSYFESALPYLEVFYQPIYNLNEKKLNVAEALYDMMMATIRILNR